MARRSPITTIALLGGAYWLYTSGTLNSLLAQLGLGPVPVIPGLPPPGGNCTGNLEMMRQVNPNIISQMATWKALRSARGEDPKDWAAFRAHVIGILAPDPGPAAPPEFCA